MRFVYKSVEHSWKWRIYTRLQSTQLYNCGFILFGLVIARYMHKHVHLSVLQSPAHTNTHHIKQFRIGINRKRLNFFWSRLNWSERVTTNIFLERIVFGSFIRNASLLKFISEYIAIEIYFRTRCYRKFISTIKRDEKQHAADNKNKLWFNQFGNQKQNSWNSVNFGATQRTRGNNDEKNCQFMHMSMPNNGNWYFFRLSSHTRCVSVFRLSFVSFVQSANDV